MEKSKWTVTFQVFRQKGQNQQRFDQFNMEVDPDEYVLDGVERIWAYHDRSLVFRHACHHSTCGACGMRVNGVEKLTCITPIHTVCRNGGTIRVEPLRNFPIVSDLAVDMSSLYTRMELVGHREVLPADEAEIRLDEPTKQFGAEAHQFIRLADCIECGLCISACPIAATSTTYLGPAVLAGAHQSGLYIDPYIDHEDGVWRCHSAFECTAVCPSFVEPGDRIMELRKRLMGQRIRQLFRPGAAKRVVKEASR
jgi:succinate dehydrogenase / fumarate reductase iron-sulfur subunit